MGLVVLLPLLILVFVVLLAPLMLPGALIVLVGLVAVDAISRHHAKRAVDSH
jgi:hypothetical protein